MNTRDYDGQTALMYASKWGHADAVGAMVKGGKQRLTFY